MKDVPRFMNQDLKNVIMITPQQQRCEKSDNLEPLYYHNFSITERNLCKFWKLKRELNVPN